MMAEKGKDKIKEKEDELSAYKAAFDTFDWNRNGTIPTKVCLELSSLVKNYETPT